MSGPIAIIGAGMAGLSAATLLKSSGFETVLFEKSQGLGGRMATRRVGDLQFDHGAQYFTARSPAFKAIAGQWQAEGYVREWFEGAYVGTPGMTSPARAMAKGLQIITGCQVSGLSSSATGWSVLDAGGIIATKGNGQFRSVILAMPAPQVKALAATAGAQFAGCDQAVYAPCWALMLAYEQACGLKLDRMKPNDDMLAWIARNDSKPGHPASSATIVIHASPDWSRQHLEQPAEWVADTLLARAHKIAGLNAQPSYMAAHRWRYALVEKAAQTPFTWDDTTSLGACGDWCLGARVEAAFTSGTALASHIVQRQESGHA